MPKTEKPKVKLTMEVLGKEWVSEAPTVKEALEKIKVDYIEIKGNGLIRVNVGDKEVEKLMNMKNLRRIFSNKIVLNTWAKNLEFLSQ